VAAIRAALIGDRITLAQAAAAFGVTERSIYNAIEAHGIPFVKVFGVRYLALGDLRRALVPDPSRAPRGRGRPRKAA
jgi:excisionase family DNA binding protein